MKLAQTANTAKNPQEYADQVKPGGFALIPILYRPIPNGFGTLPRLIGPFAKTPTKQLSQSYVDRDDPSGQAWRITTTPPDGPWTAIRGTATVQTLQNVANQYTRHPEPTAVTAQGDPCHADTIGLLHRPIVQINQLRRIGKETADGIEDEASLYDLDTPKDALPQIYPQPLTVAETTYQQAQHTLQHHSTNTIRHASRCRLQPPFTTPPTTIAYTSRALDPNTITKILTDSPVSPATQRRAIHTANVIASLTLLTAGLDQGSRHELLADYQSTEGLGLRPTRLCCCGCHTPITSRDPRRRYIDHTHRKRAENRRRKRAAQRTSERTNSDRAPSGWEPGPPPPLG